MINKITALLLLVGATPCLQGAELVWDYDSGWTRGFVMTLDTKSGTIHLHDREFGLKSGARLRNSTNVVAYLAELLKRIPEPRAGEWMLDGGVSRIAISADGRTTSNLIYMVNPPSAIPLNEGYSPAEELKAADAFRRNVDAFLIVHTLNQIKTQYFSKPSQK
jgi:hypothetical protein